MKSTLAILFVILLTGLVDVRADQPIYYDGFLKRLGKCLPNQNILPLEGDVIEDLKETSDKFKELCIQYDADVENEKFAPVVALDKAIKHIFNLYKKSAKEHKYMLNYLEVLDPIGLNVYLTQKNVDESSSNFIDSVEEFQTILHKEMLMTDEIQRGIEEFYNRLEKSIVALSSNILPFTEKGNVIEKLKNSSEKFRLSCYVYDNAAIKEEAYSPVNSLNQVIGEIFDHYKESAKENRDILNDIESVDPIGLNIYLTQKNVKNSSPEFIPSVKEFWTAMCKKMPIIAGSQYFMSDFFEFSERIKTIVENPLTTGGLPFTLEINIVANLRATTNEFKNRCVEFESELKLMGRNFLPMLSLNRTIQYFFGQYKESANRKKSIKMLNEIQSVDPIGFHVFLTKKHVSILSPKLIEEFYATMLDRVNLFKSRKSDSYIERLKKNRSAQLHNIPENIRIEVTSEYKPLNHETINHFIEIATKQLPNIKMYPIGIDKFVKHNSSKTNDVQILYDGEVGSNELGHAICIYYQASSHNVLVYDSLMNDKLEPRHKKIITKLYPFHKVIVFQTPKTIQENHCLTQADAVYAIMYATMLLLNADPSQVELKLNAVFGDASLYMRLHILNMFANRKLFLMKNEHKIRTIISKIVSPKCINSNVKQ